jgi:ribosomal 50S subunit-recycling heat shock protein
MKEKLALVRLDKLIRLVGLAKSNAEAIRLIKQGAVSIVVLKEK